MPSSPSPLAVGFDDAGDGPSSAVSQRLVMEDYVESPSPERWRLLVEAMAKERRTGRASSAGGGRSRRKRAAFPAPADRAPPSVVRVGDVDLESDNADNGIRLPALLEFTTTPRAKRASEAVIQEDDATAGTPAGVSAAKTTSFPAPADRSPPSVVGVGDIESDGDDVDDSVRLLAWVEFPTPPRPKRASEVGIKEDDAMTAATPTGASAAKTTAFPAPADRAPPSVVGVGDVKSDCDDVDDGIGLLARVEFPTPPLPKRALKVAIEEDDAMTAATPTGTSAAETMAADIMEDLRRSAIRIAALREEGKGYGGKGGSDAEEEPFRGATIGQTVDRALFLGEMAGSSEDKVRYMVQPSREEP